VRAPQAPYDAVPGSYGVAEAFSLTPRFRGAPLAARPLQADVKALPDLAFLFVEISFDKN